MKQLFLTFLCLSILYLAACTGSNRRELLLSFVPSDCYSVLAVDWHAIEKDGDLKTLVKGARIEKLLNDLEVRTETVTDFVVFGDLQQSGKANSALIAKGTFDSKAIVTGLKNRGWTESTFEGRQIYFNPNDSSCLTTYASNLFIVGTEWGVKAAIEAKTKPEMRFTSNRRYKILSSNLKKKNPPILLMVALPETTQAMANAALQISSTVMSFAGIAPLGELLNKIGLPQGLACAISRKNGFLLVEASAIMKDEASAEFVYGTLKIMKSVVDFASQRGASKTELDSGGTLRSMSIEKVRQVLTIRITVAPGNLPGGLNRSSCDWPVLKYRFDYL
jgi:hypothetical protein